MGEHAERQLRFGAFLTTAASRAQVAGEAAALEAQGFTDLVVADHFAPGELDPFLALQIAADATSRARLGTMVVCNDFRHPAMLAKQAASLDNLCGGRLDLGMGAGWVASEYDSLGLVMDAPGVRVARLGEAVAVVDGLLNGGAGASAPFMFEGRHYRVHGPGVPAPAQAPLPILVGGGGPAVLRVGGRQAAMVSVMARSAGGRIDAADVTREAIERKIGWVREAAGERFGAIVLSGLLQDLVITSDRRAAAEAYLARARAGQFPLTMSRDLSVDDVLGSPLVGFGTPAEIAEHLTRVRDELGISYFCGLPGMAPDLARVIAAA